MREVGSRKREVGSGELECNSLKVFDLKFHGAKVSELRVPNPLYKKQLF